MMPVNGEAVNFSLPAETIYFGLLVRLWARQNMLLTFIYSSLTIHF